MRVIYGEHRYSVYFHILCLDNGNSLMVVQSGLYAALDSFVGVLSSTLLIVIFGFSEFWSSIIFHPATSMSNMGDIN
jgi:hypothetical protein